MGHSRFGQIATVTSLHGRHRTNEAPCMYVSECPGETLQRPSLIVELSVAEKVSCFGCERARSRRKPAKRGLQPQTFCMETESRPGTHPNPHGRKCKQRRSPRRAHPRAHSKPHGGATWGPFTASRGPPGARPKPHVKAQPIGTHNAFHLGHCEPGRAKSNEKVADLEPLQDCR